MNKKLLFGIMSLAALTACTNNDFESQNVAQQEASPIQFEVLNNNDAFTRASMSGNKVIFSAEDGDLFTLYHGGTIGADPAPLTDFENATYTANSAEGKPATLTTPTMIKLGKAIMTWPADTTFRADPAGLSIVIPQSQTEKIQYEIPYVSDVIDIAVYAPYNEDPAKGAVTAYNTAGKDRKYSVYMRPMASQLNLNAEYNGTDAKIAELETGEDGIKPIKVTSIELLTTPGGGTTDFTTEIPLKFAEAATYVPDGPAVAGGIQTMWNAADAKNAWSHVTCFDVAGIVPAGQVDKLTTTYLNGNKSAKFLILPQATIPTTGVADGGVVVNTIYGKVVIADPDNGNPHLTKYTTAEYNNAWYRYLPNADKITVATNDENVSQAAGADGLCKTVARNLQLGMRQTINYMSTYEAKASLPAVQSEDIGVALTRYVNVNLGHLDMSELHIKNDKQLRDAVRVWDKMGLDDVTVYLDGDAEDGDLVDDDVFTISQQTIKTINDINKKYYPTKTFKVKPCTDAGEECETIVITGGGDVQDMPFIVDNLGTQAKVAFNEGETWKWKGTVKVNAAGVYRIYNWGTMVNDEAGEFTLKTTEWNDTQNDVMLVNQGTWNITKGTLFVQFDVTNRKDMNISKGAQFREDGNGHLFRNWAAALPTRFGGDDDQIGTIVNNGVFATVNSGKIYNHGLIEHADKDAKTYISENQTAGASFNTPWGAANKMGRINLPWSNKDEDNVSIDADLAQGFVSVTIDEEATITDGKLNASVVGNKVNYVIVNKGVESIEAVSAQVKYLEINQPGTEIAWNVPTTTEYDGLIVLSDVNIKLGTKIIATTTYLDEDADMYVGGKFNIKAIAAEGADPAYAKTNWDGYYGATSGNVATNYVTYK